MGQLESSTSYERVVVTKIGETWLSMAVGLTAAGLIIAPAVALAQPGKVKLAPHRAVYDMSLERSASGSGVVELTGRMVYELTGNACDGYTQNMRFVTRSVDRNGKPSIMDLRSSFWEDGAGKRFRFDTNQYRDERLAEESSGDARRGKAEDQIAVKIAKPKQRKLTFDRKILFPVQHSINLLAAAREGKAIYSSDLYDGSEKGTKVYATTAVLGDKRDGTYNASLARVKNSEALDGLSSWPISLSYFDPAKGGSDTLPSYELGFVFFENGVSRRLLIDYGRFAIRGKLTQLEMLKDSSCDK